MGAEKELEPGHHDKDYSHIVQALDASGRTVSRDPFKSEADAEAKAADLRAQGFAVEVSSLEPKPKDGS